MAGRFSTRVVTGRARRRWAVVATGTAVLCALPALIAAWPVPGSALTAAQLRTRIMASASVAYQGYAESTVDLGLPSLPDLGNVTALLDGSTDQYAWYRSPRHWRSDVLTAAGEDDTYQTVGSSWLWSYGRDLITQVIGSQPVRLPEAADLLPPALARRLLGYAGAAVLTRRIGSQRIAGIDAAGLRLVPVGQPTTIGAVDIWADPATGLPVQVEVFGQGASSPALVSRFLDVSLSKPALSVVTPSPASDVGYNVASLPDVSRILTGYGPPLPAALGPYRRVASPAGLPDIAAYGAGFARFAVLPLPVSTGQAAISAASSVGAGVHVPEGSAVLVSTPLLGVLLARTTYGQVYLLTGAVTGRVLTRAATALLASQ